MKKMGFRLISIILIVALCASMLSACGSSESTPTPEPASTQIPEENVDVPIEPLIEEDPVVVGLSDEQRASMAMLNYLAYVVQDINASKRSRVTLEEAFDDLMNDIEKSKIDAETNAALDNILDTIKEYKMNDIEFERLAFLSGQDDASTILSVVPDPLVIMDSLSEKGPMRTLAGLAVSTLSTVAESSYTSEEELAYLSRKWELESNEERALMDSRTDMFNYMVRIAQDLPAGITLTENDIEKFVNETNETRGAAKLSWLETNQDKYQYFGHYWLELADSYFENGDYENCLAAIETYRANDTGIFILDKRLARSLPFAVLAAKEVLDSNTYEAVAADYIDTIVSNIGDDDWGLRYYAAMTYIELYKQSNKAEYLDKAYNVTIENIRNLIPEQRKQNTEYIEDVAEAKAENEKDKEETSIIKAYNKFLKNKRKTELPPVYGPLLRNCELLFAIAERKNISDSDKRIIDSLLHEDPVFLSYELDKKFSYSKTSSIPGLSNESWGYSGIMSEQKFTLPVVLAPTDTKISADVVTGGETIHLEDWSVDEVERNKSKDIYDFEAVYSCKAPKPIVFKTGDTITLQLIPPGAVTDEDIITVKMVVDKLTVGVPHFKVESIEPPL